jgi:hypothetical protein
MDVSDSDYTHSSDLELTAMHQPGYTTRKLSISLPFSNPNGSSSFQQNSNSVKPAENIVLDFTTDTDDDLIPTYSIKQTVRERNNIILKQKQKELYDLGLKMAEKKKEELYALRVKMAEKKLEQNSAKRKHDQIMLKTHLSDEYPAILRNPVSVNSPVTVNVSVNNPAPVDEIINRTFETLLDQKINAGLLQFQAKEKILNQILADKALKTCHLDSFANQENALVLQKKQSQEHLQSLVEMKKPLEKEKAEIVLQILELQRKKKLVETDLYALQVACNQAHKLIDQDDQNLKEHAGKVLEECESRGKSVSRSLETMNTHLDALKARKSFGGPVKSRENVATKKQKYESPPPLAIPKAPETFEFVQFFILNGGKYPFVDSDLVTMDKVFDLAVISPITILKEQVISEARRALNSGIICTEDEGQSSCKNKNCTLFHHIDFQKSDEELAMRYISKILDPKNPRDWDIIQSMNVIISLNTDPAQALELTVKSLDIEGVLLRATHPVFGQASVSPLPSLKNHSILLKAEFDELHIVPSMQELKNNSKDIDMWIEAASYALFYGGEGGLSSAYEILAEALVTNPNSEILWTFMIEVFKCQYPNETEKLIPIYKRAIQNVPGTNTFLWQYILIETDIFLKLDNLIELVDILCSESKSPQNSSCLVNALVQLLLLSTKSDIFFQQISSFCIGICSGENASLVLDLKPHPITYSVNLDVRIHFEKKHYCFFALCVISMLKLKYLPSNLFFDSPFDQICHLELFLLPWPKVALNIDNIQECELIFTAVLGYIGQSSSILYHMVYRNRLDMLEYCLGISPQSMADIVSVKNYCFDDAYQCHLKAKYLMLKCGANTEQALNILLASIRTAVETDHDAEPFFWNSLFKILLHTKDCKSAVLDRLHSVELFSSYQV